MRFTLRPAFALVALGTFAVCALLGACADAENPQNYPANLTKVIFNEVKDTPENRQKYPFIVESYSDLKDIGATNGSKVKVAEVNAGKIKNVVFEIIEGSACGVYCQFNVYAKTQSGFKDILDLMANQPAYLQICPDQTSLITTESYGVAQWVYNGDRFNQDAAGTYSSLQKVPACAVKK